MAPSDDLLEYSKTLDDLDRALSRLFAVIEQLPHNAPLLDDFGSVTETSQNLRVRLTILQHDLEARPSAVDLLRRLDHAFRSRSRVRDLSKSLRNLQRAVQNLAAGVRLSQEAHIRSTRSQVHDVHKEVQTLFGLTSVNRQNAPNASTPNLTVNRAFGFPQDTPSLTLSPRQRGVRQVQGPNANSTASTTNLEVEFERMMSQDASIHIRAVVSESSGPAHQQHVPPPFNFHPQVYMNPHAGQMQGAAHQQGFQAANTSRGQFIGPQGRHAPTMSAFNDRQNPQISTQPLAPTHSHQAAIGFNVPPGPLVSSRYSFSSGHSSQSSVYPNSSSSGHSVHRQGHPGGPYASSSTEGHSNHSLAPGTPLYYPTNISAAHQYAHGGHGHSGSSISSHWQGVSGGLVPTSHNLPTAMPPQAEQDSFDDMYMSDE